MIPGRYEYNEVIANQFLVTIRRRNDTVFSQVLSPLRPKGASSHRYPLKVITRWVVKSNRQRGLLCCHQDVVFLRGSGPCTAEVLLIALFTPALSRRMNYLDNQSVSFANKFPPSFHTITKTPAYRWLSSHGRSS